MLVVIQTDAGQEMLTPDEFAQRFSHQNPPGGVRLTTGH